MLPKDFHVIVIGLTEDERKALDANTLRFLRYSDPAWQYTSYGCANLREAVAKAKEMPQVHILYVGRKTLPGAPSSSNLEQDYSIAGDLMRNHPTKPVITYPDPDQPNKLAVAIFKLWRERNRGAR